MNDVSAEEMQSLRKIRYEELQKIKEQLHEQDMKWQEVSIPSHPSSCVLLKGWVLPAFHDPKNLDLACAQRSIGLCSKVFHLMRILVVLAMAVQCRTGIILNIIISI